MLSIPRSILASSQHRNSNEYESLSRRGSCIALDQTEPLLTVGASLDAEEVDHRPVAPEKSASSSTARPVTAPDDDLESNYSFHSTRHQPRRRFLFSKYFHSLFRTVPSVRLSRKPSRGETNGTDDSSTVRSVHKIRPLRVILTLIFISLAMLGLIQFISLCAGAFLTFFPDDIDFVLDHWGQVGQPSEGLAHWPTDFSADIQPVQCHSHNDYWRKVPLYEALHYGCTGVEADVWLYDEDLFVGHSTSSLTRNRTLKSLYINPLLDILEAQNPLHDFHPEHTEFNGVFDTNPEQPLILLIDFKTSGSALWPHVVQQLEPLREKGYLTHWNGSTIVQRPITVVGSGNTPFDLLTANNTYRDVFFDAPLNKMAAVQPKTSQDPDGVDSTEPDNDDSPPSKHTSSQNKGQGNSVSDPNAKLPPYSIENSYYASVDFKKSIGFVWRSQFSAKQLQKIRAQIQGAHDLGLKVRYWGIPSWPRGLRNHVWHVLIREGADMLNVDDLKGATMRDWRKGKGWWH